MKISEAKRIIEAANRPTAYRVSFEIVENRRLVSEFVPDRGDEPFQTYDLAKEFGQALAAATEGRFVNFHIVHADTFMPTGQWRQRNREVTQ